MADRFVRSAVVLVALLTALVTTAAGQFATVDGIQDPLAQFRSQILSSDDGVIVEGPVDATAYQVGPGDVFSIGIGGVIPTRQSISVGADGRLVIPEAGGVIVAGLMLDDARQVVILALQRRFENVDVDVSLEKPRQFFVHVTGAVPMPGKYVASAVSRVDDAVQLAYAKRQFDMQIARSGRTDLEQESIDRAVPHPSSERPSLPADYRVSLRSIRISHADGRESMVDLLRYYATGDRSQNPYLLDGDIINVATYHAERTSVRVAGPVPFAGLYPYRPGDRLSDILTIANGSSDLSAIEEVRITSRTSDGPASRTINASELPWADRVGTTQDLELSAGDLVHVHEPVVESAGAFGWFNYPATYPIVGGKTTVTDLIRVAGGLRVDADISLAYIDRHQPTLLKGEPGTADFDFFSRAFLTQSKAARRVVVDVAAILRGEADDVTLENGDTLVIPKRESSVYVVGNVLRPGFVPFEANRNAGYYVDEAGGEGPLSRGTHVINGATGERQSGRSAIVTSGSTVFVDREGLADTPEMQSLLVTDRTSKRQLRLASTQTIIAGVSAVAAIITTFVAISK